MNHHTCLLASVTLLTLSGCSCSSDKTGGNGKADTTSVAYHEGRDAAQTMIYTCGDSVEVQDFLLDFHADTYQTELKDGPDAARDRRQGFEDALREFDPDMAARIVN